MKTVSGMAQIFLDTLLANGVKARKVFLQDNLTPGANTHVTVEAWVNGKWRVYDPTFHIALRSGGERVGILEARDKSFYDKVDQIEYEFLGDVRYPARLETYPIRFERLLNYAFVDLRENHFPHQMLGYQPKKKDGVSTLAEEQYRALYFGALLLPLLALIFFLIALASWFRHAGSVTEATRSTAITL